MIVIEPKNAVIIPNGISPAIKVLASVSQISTNPPPKIIENGNDLLISYPKISRTIFGIINPTQPTKPATEMIEVVSKTEIPKTKFISLFLFTPSE